MTNSLIDLNELNWNLTESDAFEIWPKVRHCIDIDGTTSFSNLLFTFVLSVSKVDNCCHFTLFLCVCARSIALDTADELSCIHHETSTESVCSPFNGEHPCTIVVVFFWVQERKSERNDQLSATKARKWEQEKCRDRE